ncbi:MULTISPECIES: STAS domain-containing protein [Bacillus]|uniref:STAS domain-containing protein n=1 Tax=Bacillus TaxID=1386 RepID=UPI000BB872F8|nr:MULTISPECIES: STAS domain-containing protein [Bacillus]
MGLTIKKEVEGSMVTFYLNGVLDITTSNAMDQYLQDTTEIDTLVFDLTEIEFIDSTGIGLIINTVYVSQEKHFKVRLQGVDELTNEVFETVGLYQILEAMQGEVV